MIQSQDHIEVHELLAQFNEPLYFMPNPGNAGDSLIFCATLQYFEIHGIHVELLDSMGTDLTGKVVLYACGGNFGGLDSRAARFVELNHARAKALILLPHTIFDAEGLLSQLGPNCYLFCRELVSYQHAKQHASNASVYHHDDMVFSCDIAGLLSKDTRSMHIREHLAKELSRRIGGDKAYDFGLGLSGYVSCTLFTLKQTLGLWRPQDDTLYALRTDVEKTKAPMPKNNVDISAIFELSSCVPELAYISTRKFLEIIDKHKVIKTNRLHVGIASALLGKEVHLMASNYFKIRAIYEYSIRDKFPNVIWEDQ
jgi:exopolysaccharide biosynthesis predicted pyruvyltransferase EpsI